MKEQASLDVAAEAATAETTPAWDVSALEVSLDEAKRVRTAFDQSCAALEGAGVPVPPQLERQRGDAAAAVAEAEQKLATDAVPRPTAEAAAAVGGKYKYIGYGADDQDRCAAKFFIRFLASGEVKGEADWSGQRGPSYTEDMYRGRWELEDDRVKATWEEKERKWVFYGRPIAPPDNDVHQHFVLSELK